jgi:nucleoside-diphosphate-sugar epimerase
MTSTPDDRSISATPLKRVLVTGGAGFLGSTLSERLLDRGVQVVALDCFVDFYPRKLKESNLAGFIDHPGFQLLELDLAVDDLDEIVESVDTVFHLAAQAGVRGSFGDGFDNYLHNNVRATQRLLEAVARHSVDSFVYASSSSVYGNANEYPTRESAPRLPVSPYGLTKCATEDLALLYERLHEIPTVGLRYFTAYGPRQRPDMAFSRFVAAALADKPITVLGDGMQIRDFTFVDDVVDSTIAAAERGRAGSVYNVGGGTPVTLLEAIAVLEEKAGRKLTINHRPSARGDARRTGADTSRIRADLDTVPSTPLDEGIARQVEWMRDRSALPQSVG